MKGTTLTYFLLFTTGLQAIVINYHAKEVCSLKGSTVVLKCSYDIPTGDSFIAGFWYKNDSKIPIQLNVPNVNRFVYNSHTCVLRIANLTLHDSGYYEYKITTKTSTSSLRDSSRVNVHVADAPRKDCWGVSYSSTSFCVLMGSTVDIPCTYGFPTDQTVTTTLWYREDKRRKVLIDLRLEKDYEGRVEHLSTEEHNCTLRIRDVGATDSGQYRFRYVTNTTGGAFSGGLVTISVTDLQVSMAAGTLTEGGNVTLTCDTSCKLKAVTPFIWYKNTRPTRHRAINSTLHLNPVSSEDAGSYSCAVRGHEQHRSPEAALDVRYAPRNTAVLAAPHGDRAVGESLSLTCTSDANPPVHNYTWHRKVGDELKLIGAGQSYVVANISYETSGLYYCVAQNNVGEQHSAAVSVPIAGQGSAKGAAIGILIVVPLLLIPGLLWLRKQKSRNPASKGNTTISVQQTDPSPVYDDVAAVAVASDLAWRRKTEAHNDVQYASVQFKSSKEAKMAPYASVEHPQTQTAQEDVQYALLNFSRPKDTPPAEVDPVIYNTVTKPPRTRIH
ncbi:sialoadhesin-like isoform X1 [Alosa sapidissima]|uniref:sialoadhesin-like isoform X1 n=2 Tax=Alosa sapidissima TaxID=34773 RepID=UPI001C09E9D4|nr:sialoadhesin-like isoform X1 [Alosa sapidissima]